MLLLDNSSKRANDPFRFLHSPPLLSVDGNLLNDKKGLTLTQLGYFFVVVVAKSRQKRKNRRRGDKIQSL